MGIFDVFNTSDQTAAAGAQTAGINAGYNQLSTLYGAGQGALTQNYTAGLQPYQQNYTQAASGTNAYGNAVGLNGPSGNAQAIQSFMNNPGYQFQQSQGNNAINAQAAATGTSGSGNQSLALSNFNQGLAGTSWNNYVGSLAPYFGASQTAASGIGSLYSGLGTNLNQSFMGQGNAAYGAQTSIGNANANADLAGLNASANTLNAGMNAGLGILGFLPGAKALGFLSDAKAKEEIEPVGELYDGQPVYRYRYKGDPRHQIGLLAQEVENAAPDAVFQLTPTLKGVNYKTATNLAAALADFANDDEPPATRASYGAELLNMAA